MTASSDSVPVRASSTSFVQIIFSVNKSGRNAQSECKNRLLGVILLNGIQAGYIQVSNALRFSGKRRTQSGEMVHGKVSIGYHAHQSQPVRRANLLLDGHDEYPKTLIL